MDACSVALEAAGKALLQRQSLQTVGKYLVTAGEALAILSKLFGELSEEHSVSKDAGQRCGYASEQMILAGSNLLPADQSKPKPAGKSWLKGG